MKKRLSASFSAEEVTLLNAILSTMARGGDLRVLRQNTNFPKVYAKVTRMVQRLEAPRQVSNG